MKITTALCSLCLVVAIKAQTIKLNYQPKGVIVVFHLDSLTICTDTAAVFNAIRYYSIATSASNDNKIRNLILSQVKNSRNDTVSFWGCHVEYNDSICKTCVDEWDINDIIIYLTENNKMELFGLSRHKIKKVHVKNGMHYNNLVNFRVDINKLTKHERIYEIMYEVIREPTW